MLWAVCVGGGGLFRLQTGNKRQTLSQLPGNHKFAIGASSPACWLHEALKGKAVIGSAWHNIGIICCFHQQEKTRGQGVEGEGGAGP